METTSHTPLPWRLSTAGLSILSGPPDESRPDGPVNGRLVALTDPGAPLEERRATAALVVRACNSHAALVDACEKALLLLDGRGLGGLEELGQFYAERCDDEAARLRAALAKAKGGTQ